MAQNKRFFKANTHPADPAPPAPTPAPVVTLQSETLTHVRPLQKLFTVVITGPDGCMLARYENIPGFTKQDAIHFVEHQLLLEAHPA
jgi:hypothetical protein